jgi:microcystin-dependent protein
MPSSIVTSPQRRRFLARLGLIAAGAALPWRPRAASAATQAVGPYLGEIMLVSWNFPPKGWTFCNGQLLPINQNQALFSVLGTTYGGDGRVNFALPNLQGCVAIHQGQGPGLSPRALGERAGETAHTLVLSELAAHTHVARASSAAGTAANPSATLVPARNAGQIPQWASAADTTLSPSAISPAGGSQPHSNLQPYLVLNYVIALQGTFPTQ